MCPIKQLLDEHDCGDFGVLPEDEFKEVNKRRKLKLQRYGLTEDVLKYREARNYTPDDAIQVHYAIETSQNNDNITDESEEEEWREEDDSKYYRDGGNKVEEVEKPEGGKLKIRNNV